MSVGRCLPAERDRAYRAARAMERAHTAVLSADVYAPSERGPDRWSIEATLADVEYTPPEVAGTLAEYNLSSRAEPRAPDVLRVVAVV